MSGDESTCWTMIESAAGADAATRESFARVYEPVVRAYLLARWRGGPVREHVDDAVQDVFVECYKSGGALERASRDRSGGFRAYLYGIARNVALRVEASRGRKVHGVGGDDDVLVQQAGDEPSLSRVFDRSWAESMMRQARERQQAKAQAQGERCVRRVELLRLRFNDGLPIREIAEKWGEPAEQVHREYAKAREEFRAALFEVIRFHRPECTAAAAERECLELLGLLGSDGR
ncbi:MAG: sigma-70 family RNA polymerase sigma factor [Planctomycetes bacterium]|nr:sigma-70 family RNA polymerase sigma factor [Planctomycetota bacterium]